ncbi:MAG: glucuronate isomerase [Bacillota bacterium]|nr:glucuronate isomerase [Bacillota bacterium]
MNENFLLHSKLSQYLYHEYAENLPLIDYHNHLPIADIAEKRSFTDLADLWLSDPYKHRAMRICGIEERYITGDSDNLSKFRQWSTIVPDLVGNPLYHWSELELERIFSIQLPINKNTAEEIWFTANEMLADPAFSAKGLLDRFNVEYTAPCTQITADLSPFACTEGVSPSLRGDDLFPVTAELVNKLQAVTGVAIDSFDRFAEALTIRLEAFHAAGCRFADHALDNGFIYTHDDGNNGKRFAAFLHNGLLDDADVIHINSAVLRILGGAYARHEWVMQLHMGALRHTSSRLRTIAGQAGGFAGIGGVSAATLTAMLDDIEQGESGLPRTVLFTINPADNAALAVLSGSFSQDGVRGKVQQGPAWWWCDHLYGMRELLEIMSTYGVLSTFIGMTTDSRSFTSLVRHEYFRRVLCGWIGDKVAEGAFPDDVALLGHLVDAVCYRNARMILKKSGL